VRDEPQEPESGDSAPPPTFGTPHSNGAAHRAKAGRRHAPWEFVVLALFVAIVGIGIILGWTLVGSHSPERLDDASAAAVSAACLHTQAELKALPNPSPRLGADRVARVRAENVVLRAMVARFETVHPRAKTPAAALQGWSADWGRMVDARGRYADDLAKAATTGAKVRLILPAVNAIKPVTNQMDDFVRENDPHLKACFTTALQLEVVEGPRDYQKVTQ
jgi:hypothetical protein